MNGIFFVLRLSQMLMKFMDRTVIRRKEGMRGGPEGGDQRNVLM